MKRLNCLAGAVALAALATPRLVAQAPETPDFAPVTQEMLNDPAPGDWLHWRRTQNAWGYSPLDQIHVGNVDRLQLIWSWAMDDTGAQEAAPLIHNGVLYLPNPGGVVQALDAANGDLIWEFRPEMANDGPRTASGLRGVQKNIAIFGERIFAATQRATILALDARNGELVWETRTADPNLGYRYTAGPIVANGRLVTGITGCGRYKDDVCFITGHDPASGEEIWRTSTVARPGDPGGDTWGDLPLRYRAGSDAWIAGSYDPDLDLVYWATAQAKPWARAVRGTDGAALYTNSSLALDPATGEMIWYYQYLPGETHDMDEVFESLLIDSEGRKQLFKMGKLGILWQLDRETGEFLEATDVGYQNLVDVDRETGEVTYRPEMIPEIGVEIDMCPSTSGFKSWRAMSYDPNTRALYIPMTMNCELATFGPVERELGGGGAGPVRRVNKLHPYSGGNLGELLVIDIVEGDILWRHRTESPMNTAALSTAGGVVFAGDWDRNVYAYEAGTGRILWQTRLPTSAQGFPVSYLAEGRQFIAIPSGTGGASWSTMVPNDLIPHVRRPNNGNSLHVFALPKEAIGAGAGAAAALPAGAGRPTPEAATPPVIDAPGPTERLETSLDAAAARTVWDGVYSAAQAERGAAAYLEFCASCHGEDLRGGSNAPSMVGSSFYFVWNEKTLFDLFESVRTLMPSEAPNSLPRQTYLEIVAHMLELNRFPAGDAELDAEELGNILIAEER